MCFIHGIVCLQPCEGTPGVVMLSQDMNQIYPKPGQKDFSQNLNLGVNKFGENKNCVGE
jgi:hypothetical protein